MKLATIKGRAANKRQTEKLATQAKCNRPRYPNAWSKVVDKYSRAKETIASFRAKRPLQIGLRQQPCASDMGTDRYNIPSVEYRDIDLGPHREAIYADTVPAKGDDDQICEPNFDMSAWTFASPLQHESVHDEVSSGAALGSWKGLQHATSWSLRGRVTLALPHEPSPTTFIITSKGQEGLSRPTTSSTDRKDSGEFLRRLQTSSSAGSRLHSRNISDASAITLPTSEDGDELKKAPAGEMLSMVKGTMECESVYSTFSQIPASVKSCFGRGVCQGKEVQSKNGDEQGDPFEDVLWLQAPDHAEFAPCEMNVLEEGNAPTAEEEVETRPRNEDDKVFMGPKSSKSLYLHVEQPARSNDRSYATTIQDEPGVITKSYGEFDAAFAQQVKDYGKLLDDLADPDATAQALELVSNRLSVYLNNYNSSSVDVGLIHPIRTDTPEKRQLAIFSSLDSFLDSFLDDEESDRGVQASSTKVFACPVQPMSTPFSDLEQFIGDEDDLDIDVSTAGGLAKKPTINDSYS